MLFFVIAEIHPDPVSNMLRVFSISPMPLFIYFQVIPYKKPGWSGGDVNGKSSNRHSPPSSRAELKIPVGPARNISAAMAVGRPPGCLSRAPKQTWEPVGKPGRLERFKFRGISGGFWP